MHLYTITFRAINEMNYHIGKILLVAGIIITILGLILTFGEKIAILKYFGKLPGDIRIEKDNFSFYFPIATCIVLSIIITVILKIISKFR